MTSDTPQTPPEETAEASTGKPASAQPPEPVKKPVKKPAEPGPRRFHKPNAVSILITVLAVGLMLCLGTWQVDRLGWKEDLLAKIAERSSGQAVPLPERIDNPELFDFQRVSVSGIFFHEMAVHVGPRTLDGKAGIHVITPLQMPSGAVVLVNRGYAPTGWTPNELDNPVGLTTFSGIARVPEEKSVFTPDNVPEDDQWYWIDTAAMAEHMGLNSTLPVIVYASELANPGAYPVGGQARIDIPNDHLQYAIFWYGMALVMGFVFILYHYRRDENVPQT